VPDALSDPLLLSRIVSGSMSGAFRHEPPVVVPVGVPSIIILWEYDMKWPWMYLAVLPTCGLLFESGCATVQRVRPLRGWG